MGFSKAVCGLSPLNYTMDGQGEAITQLSFQCERTTEIMEIMNSGLMLDYLFGGEDNTFRACAPKDHYDNESNDFNQGFPVEEFNQMLNKQCKG